MRNFGWQKNYNFVRSMSTLSFNARSSWSVKHLFKSIAVPAWMSSTTVKLVVSGISICLLVGYIAQISNLTTSGYEIVTLEKKVEGLSGDTQKLTSELATYQSISSVQKRVQGIAMVPASNIKYIKISTEAAVAQR